MTTPKLILLVDDDADDREFFKDAVSEIDASIRCLTARDGIEALEFLKSAAQIPDFIFLDLNMPRMNGKECLKKIKQINLFSAIPVIIYSTSKMERDEREISALGAAHFLQKPSDFEDIREAISSVLSGAYKKNKEAAIH